MIDADRIFKLLAMLTSSFDGERATAGAMIAKMARELKLTVPELVQAATLQDQPQPQPKQQTRQSPTYDDDAINPLISGLRRILADTPEFLTILETNFIKSVLSRHRYDSSLSDRQVESAGKIIRKAERKRRRSA